MEGVPTQEKISRSTDLRYWCIVYVAAVQNCLQIGAKSRAALHFFIGVVGGDEV